MGRACKKLRKKWQTVKFSLPEAWSNSYLILQLNLRSAFHQVNQDKVGCAASQKKFAKYASKDTSSNQTCLYKQKWAITENRRTKQYRSNKCAQNWQKSWLAIILNQQVTEEKLIPKHSRANCWKRRKYYLSSLIRHNFVCCQVTFVSNQKFVDIFTCITVNLAQPLFDIVKTLLISHIIDNLMVARYN